MKTQLIRTLMVSSLLSLFSLQSIAADNWYFRNVDRAGGRLDNVQTWSCIYKKVTGRGANSGAVKYLTVQFVTGWEWSNYETAWSACINTYGWTQSNLG